MPLSSHRNQLEYENVQTAEAELFDGEVLRLVVEDPGAAVVSTQRRYRHHPKAAGFPCVKYVGKFCLLNNPQSTCPCASPRSDNSRPPFRPLRMLYVPNLTTFSGPRLSSRLFLVRPPVGSHTPYHQKIPLTAVYDVLSW